MRDTAPDPARAGSDAALLTRAEFAEWVETRFDRLEARPARPEGDSGNVTKEITGDLAGNGADRLHLHERLKAPPRAGAGAVNAGGLRFAGCGAHRTPLRQSQGMTKRPAQSPRRAARARRSSPT